MRSINEDDGFNIDSEHDVENNADITHHNEFYLICIPWTKMMLLLTMYI